MVKGEYKCWISSCRRLTPSSVQASAIRRREGRSHPGQVVSPTYPQEHGLRDGGSIFIARGLGFGSPNAPPIALSNNGSRLCFKKAKSPAHRWHTTYRTR